MTACLIPLVNPKIYAILPIVPVNFKVNIDSVLSEQGVFCAKILLKIAEMVIFSEIYS